MNADNPNEGVVSNAGEWLLNKKLRQGLREALDAGRGRLRMDPQDLAELLGKAIDMEVDRIVRVRIEYEHRRRTRQMLRQPELYFRPNGSRSTGEGKDRYLYPGL